MPMMTKNRYRNKQLTIRRVEICLTQNETKGHWTRKTTITQKTHSATEQQRKPSSDTRCGNKLLLNTFRPIGPAPTAKRRTTYSRHTRTSTPR